MAPPEQSDVSEYEKQRLQNILANKAKLAALGIPDAKPTPKAKCKAPVYTPTVTKPARKTPRSACNPRPCSRDLGTAAVADWMSNPGGTTESAPTHVSGSDQGRRTLVCALCRTNKEGGPRFPMSSRGPPILTLHSPLRAAGHEAGETSSDPLTLLLFM